MHGFAGLLLFHRLTELGGGGLAGETERDVFHGGGEASLDAGQGTREGAIRSVGQRTAVLFGQLNRSTRVGVDIGTATAREHHRGAGVASFEFGLGRTGVVTVPLIDRERGIVAGIREEQAAQGPVGGIVDREHGYAWIGRAFERAGGAACGDVFLGVFAAIDAKRRLIFAPREGGGRHRIERMRSGGDHFSLQCGAINRGFLHAVRRENAEASDAVFEPRRAVGVRDIRHDRAARQAVASHDFQGHAIGDFPRHTAKIQREQDRAVSGRIGNGERFDPEILRRTFGGVIAGGVAGHPEGVGWRDFVPAGAGAPTGALRRRDRGAARPGDCEDEQ